MENNSFRDVLSSNIIWFIPISSPVSIKRIKVAVAAANIVTVFMYLQFFSLIV